METVTDKAVVVSEGSLISLLTPEQTITATASDVLFEEQAAKILSISPFAGIHGKEVP